MSKIARDYNVINWNDIFVEDSRSPTGLVWKVKPSSHTKIGDVAGNIWKDKRDNRQRVVVMFNGKTWYVHRVLYIMRTGYIDDDLVVDHIDGNPLNNSTDNLRLVSKLINSRNLKLYKNNSTGKTGVYFSKHGFITYAVVKCIGLDGKIKKKNFNCNKMGILPAFSAACTYRDKTILELNNKGAGYYFRQNSS